MVRPSGQYARFPTSLSHLNFLVLLKSEQRGLIRSRSFLQVTPNRGSSRDIIRRDGNSSPQENSFVDILYWCDEGFESCHYIDRRSFEGAQTLLMTKTTHSHKHGEISIPILHLRLRCFRRLEAERGLQSSMERKTVERTVRNFGNQLHSAMSDRGRVGEK